MTIARARKDLVTALGSAIVKRARNIAAAIEECRRMTGRRPSAKMVNAVVATSLIPLFPRANPRLRRAFRQLGAELNRVDGRTG